MRLLLYKLLGSILIVGLLYGYFHYSQNRLEALLVTNAQNKVLISEQKETLANYSIQLDTIKRESKNLEIDKKKAEEELHRYLGVFKRHDFNKLVEARPGLIETRVNNATKAVFEELMNETNYDITNDTPID